MERLAPQLEPNLQVTDKYAADELAVTLLEVVNISDAQSIETDSDGEIQLSEIRSKQKCLARYVSFPSPSKMISQSSSSDEEENKESMENLPLQQQVPTKLKSALKGGKSPSNKTVSWAPDVYDPPPTSLSHSIKRGTRQLRLSKKDKRRGGKRSHNTHKGKDLSKSSKDKKKKPISPSSSTMMMSYKLRDVGDDLGFIAEEKGESFGFGGSDNSCGSSSFFKVSLSNAQYGVAEAL